MLQSSAKLFSTGVPVSANRQWLFTDFTAFAVQLVKRGAALADVAAVRPAEPVEVVPADKLAGFVNQTVRFVADCSFSGTNPQSIGIRPFVKCGVDTAPQAPWIQHRKRCRYHRG